MLTLDDIENFCTSHNYDLRVSHNGRWIDQKCTPDVVWSISDFVLNYVDNVCEQFSVKDIWQSNYAKETIAETYSKPDTNEKTAENEYDKVFSQPLCLLCYAGVIKDVSDSPNRHLYVIEDRDVLEYIARNDLNSLKFLQCYIEKVLRDSNLYSVFNTFLEEQTRQSFDILKETFIDFYHKYTQIKGDYEPKRIFTKVINPIAYKYSKKGTSGGHLSKEIIVRSDLMYNRDNFRDVYKDKPKGVTRTEWLAQHPKIKIRNGYFEQMMSKAKRFLKDYVSEHRNNLSELTQFSDKYNDNLPASQIHHIFPKSEFPEIMHYLENLIALTPNQHYGFAHPKNNTQKIDLEAQKELLIAKTASIQYNLSSMHEEHIYEFSKLLDVLKIGWDDETVLEITSNNYNEVIHAINTHYESFL